MLWIRSILGVIMLGGSAFAAGPQTLPAPLSSAIARLVDPGKQTSPADPSPILGTPRTLILQGPVTAQVRADLQCSIPLAELKVADKPKFFIRQMPLPKNSPDAMPVFRAPVCPAK